MNETPEPQLQPPGAGLPKVELQVARLLFSWRRLTGSRAAFDARFNQERERIQKLYRSCDEATATRRVLIQRPRGLEDSSRNWSIWMTLDHLRIVNLGITRVITSLAKGVVPPGEASTAAVKPNALVNRSVIAEYEASCDSVLASAAAVHNLKTAVRYRHPWFGSMDAFGWHSLAGSHMGIHRVQLERIIAGMKA